MTIWQTQLAILAEVFLAMILGGIIGFERATANKPAGFRTHMLVAGAAALLFSGAIGVCVALRQFVLALAVTLLTLTVLRGVEFIERRINNRPMKNDCGLVLS